jgi:hypothetical protein
LLSVTVVGGKRKKKILGVTEHRGKKANMAHESGFEIAE